MLVNHDVTRDGQPLPRAFPDVLGREEQVEDLLTVLLRDPNASVGNGNADRVPLLPRLYANDPPRAGAANCGLNGVCRIDDDNEKHLVELAGMAEHCREFAIVRLDIGSVLVLVARNSERVPSLMYRAWPPNRDPCANSTPAASVVSIVTSAEIA